MIALLGVIIFLLLIALITLIIDTYFYPFITGQMYGGTCTKTEDCRQGLACRPDAKNPKINICQEAVLDTCPKCEAGVAVNADSCKTLIDAAVNAKTCTGVDAVSCKSFIDAAVDAKTCPAPANPANCVGFSTMPDSNNCKQFFPICTEANASNCSTFCNCPEGTSVNNPPSTTTTNIDPLKYGSITLTSDAYDCPAQTFYRMNINEPGWVGDHIQGDSVRNLLYIFDPVEQKHKLYCKPESDLNFSAIGSTQFMKFDPNDSRLKYTA